MAACYSTDPDGTVRLPFEPATGRRDSRDLGALAGKGPGPDGRRPRGYPPRPARDLDRFREERRMVSSTSRPRRSAASWKPSASPSRSSTSSWSRAPTADLEHLYAPAIGWLAERISGRRSRPAARRPPPDRGRHAWPSRGPRPRFGGGPPRWARRRSARHSPPRPSGAAAPRPRRGSSAAPRRRRISSARVTAASRSAPSMTTTNSSPP